MKYILCLTSFLFVIVLASCSTINRVNRLNDIQKVTISALEYADKHDGNLPTTDELAIYCKINPDEFGYIIVLSGNIEQHKKRVGGYPKLLISEKNGGANDVWCFGFMDGLCLIMTIQDYKRDGNLAAVEQIEKAISHRTK